MTPVVGSNYLEMDRNSLHQQVRPRRLQAYQARIKVGSTVRITVRDQHVAVEREEAVERLGADASSLDFPATVDKLGTDARS
jgi:hypothetical protein